MRVNYIDNSEKLGNVYEDIIRNNEIGVDLEFDRNSFGYGFVLCLIQISTRDQIHLVDPLAVNNLRQIWDVMEDKSILKIFHNASEDVMLLKKNACFPKNIWDTEKAAMILNYEKTGLSSLLSDFFGEELNKKEQRTNWRKRPLTEDQLNYAAQDVHFLLELKKKLNDGIILAGREDWILEEGLYLEKIEQKNPVNPFMKYKDARKLYGEAKNRLEALFNVREKYAENLDLPPYRILRNEMLVEISKVEINTLSDWLSIKSINPKLKNQAAFEEYKSQFSKSLEGNSNFDSNGKRSQKDLKLEEKLKTIRDAVKEDFGDQCAKLILSQGVIDGIQDSGDLSGLKDYVKKIVVSKADDLGIDLKMK